MARARLFEQGIVLSAAGGVSIVAVPRQAESISSDRRFWDAEFLGTIEESCRKIYDRQICREFE
jgi:hypothetical protein